LKQPSEIKEGKTDYEGIIGIEVLKVKKVDLDNEIQKVKELVNQINSHKYLRDLENDQENIDNKFKELKTKSESGFLASSKLTNIENAIAQQRESL